jgi:hypothetical protein
VRDRAREPRHHGARGPDRPRPAAHERVSCALPGAGRRAPHGRRAAGRRLLLVARAREGQGDEGDLHARGAGRAHQGLPHAPGARAGRLHALRRQGGDRCAVLPAARRRAGRVRGDDRGAPPGAGRGRDTCRASRPHDRGRLGRSGNGGAGRAVAGHQRRLPRFARPNATCTGRKHVSSSLSPLCSSSCS